MKRHRTKPENMAKRNRQYTAFGVAIALLIIFALVVGFTVGNNLRQEKTISSVAPSATQYSDSAAVRLTADPLWPQIKAVAEHFICGCMQCGDMPLVECTCAMPNGGTREKQFIREKLAIGHSTEEIIALVQAQFGGRVPTIEEIDAPKRVE